MATCIVNQNTNEVRGIASPPLSAKIATAIQPYMPACHAVSEYVGFGGTAYRFTARERAFHAPDRGVLEPDAECQGQEVIHDPCPCQYASAYGYRDEEEEPFADDIGQCTPRPQWASTRRPTATAAAPSSPAYSPSRPCLP